MHPAVARNLSLDTVPCPDPYVERLLEGVAFLAARTRLKLDAERSRFARTVLDALYPDLVAPTPAIGMVALKPGQQVQTMLAGHVVKRGTRLVSGLRPGLSTRATYMTAQDVTLWPLRGHRRRLSSGPQRAGDRRHRRGRRRRRRGGAADHARADRRRRAGRAGARPAGPALPQPRQGAGALRRPLRGDRGGRRPPPQGGALRPVSGPEIVGLRDDEALMPRTRAGFEGYRLLREYFMMPERFHFVRVDGLKPVVAGCQGGARDRVPAAPAGARACRPAADRPAALRHARDQSLRAGLQRASRSIRGGRGRWCMPTAPGRGTSRSTGSPRWRTPTATGRTPRSRRCSASPGTTARVRSGGPSGGRGGPARTSAARAGCAPPIPATTCS